jgi:hyaluronan synthase
MIYFIIQLLETLKTGHVFLFEMFVLYVFAIFFIKYVVSRRYTPAAEVKTNLTNSVIIPVYNEDPIIFEMALKSIRIAGPDEIIVVIDAKQEGRELHTIASKYTKHVYNCKLSGKRNNLICGAERSTGDVIISVDSDTVFAPDAIAKMMYPFARRAVGGVTTRQHIIDPDRDIIAKICEWMENVRFSLSMPAQSSVGAIGCLPGRAIAFRKDVLLKNKHAFLNQRFMGQKCESGDDRVLTSYALKMGYETVLQSDAVVYTDCPDNMNKFVKQQLRWARSSQRETLSSLPWLWKHPFTLFVFLTDMLTPIIFACVIMNTLYRYIMGTAYFEIPLVIGIPMALIGMNISLGIRQYPHLMYNKRDLKYLPVYVLFMSFIMTPIRIWGLVTCFHSGWLTRDIKIEGDNID